MLGKINISAAIRVLHKYWKISHLCVEGKCLQGGILEHSIFLLACGGRLWHCSVRSESQE